MILMTSNSAVAVIPESKGNYGSAKYYYYLILVTGWGWDLMSPSPIWPREEWGLPPPLHPSHGLGSKGCADRVEPGLCSLLQLLQPWLLVCLCGVGRWLLCAAGALVDVQQTGRKEKCLYTTLPASTLAAEEANMLSFSADFAGLSLSLLCCSPLVLPGVAEFSLHALPLPVYPSWGLPAQVLLGWHGISVSSVLADRTLRLRGASKPGFLGVSD